MDNNQNQMGQNQNMMPNYQTGDTQSNCGSATGFQQHMINPKQIPVNCDEAMNVTTLQDLQVASQGALVRLPDFSEGQPFVARLKRPSMLVLAKQGRIPNSLMESANTLFANSNVDVDNSNMLSEMFDVMEIICQSALVSPTLDEIKSAGVELTDEQMMAIFNYTQVGVSALQSFRKE